MRYGSDSDYDWSDDKDEKKKERKIRQKKSAKVPMTWDHWKKHGQVYWCSEKRTDDYGRSNNNQSLVRIVERLEKGAVRVENPSGYNMRVVNINTLEPVKKEEEFRGEGLNFI